MANPDAKLVDYLKIALSQGRSKEDIYKELLLQGWTIEVIQEGFAMLSQESEKEDTSKKTINIILTIAAVLVGAGIFSFIAANWKEIGNPAKITIILISMLAVYGAGWYLKEKQNFAKTGSSLILLGSIIYGAGIFLVAQMFNIRTVWPDGFILWMLGVIAMAFALELYPLFYLAIPLGFAAIFGHPFYLFNVFQSYQFLLTSSLLLVIATVVVFLTALAIYRKRSPELKDRY